MLHLMLIGKEEGKGETYEVAFKSVFVCKQLDSNRVLLTSISHSDPNVQSIPTVLVDTTIITPICAAPKWF